MKHDSVHDKLPNVFADHTDRLRIAPHHLHYKPDVVMLRIVVEQIHRLNVERIRDGLERSRVRRMFPLLDKHDVVGVQIGEFAQVSTGKSAFVAKFSNPDSDPYNKRCCVHVSSGSLDW
jgi:hypothetical protein